MVVFVADEHSVTTKFLKENKIVTDFTKAIKDLGIEIDFTDQQTWKEQLPVTQKPAMQDTSLVQQDYLVDNDDYMTGEMSAALDAINENIETAKILAGDGNLFDVMEQSEGRSAQESLNADAIEEAVVEPPKLKKRHFAPPIAIALTAIALGTTAVILYRKLVMKK